MTTYKAFHSQLTSIMETLTKAAVAEICELVDESYAVFQLEITRSHRENEALRRKLDLIETILARGHRGKVSALEEAGGRMDFAAGEFRGAREDSPPPSLPPSLHHLHLNEDSHGAAIQTVTKLLIQHSRLCLVRLLLI